MPNIGKAVRDFREAAAEYEGAAEALRRSEEDLRRNQVRRTEAEQKRYAALAALEAAALDGE